MRKTLTLVLTLAVTLGFIADSLASVKKRDPDKREVASILKKIGGEHYFEDMKVREIGMIETEIDEELDEGGIKAYYWVYSAMLEDDAGYQIIIFDNEPRYLGYYKVQLSPMECGEDYISFEQGDFDMGADPITEETDRWSVKIPDSGPPKRIVLNGPVEFEAAPTIEEVQEKVKEEREQAAEASSSSKSGQKRIKPEYRSWQIKLNGKMITVESAIFVEYKGGQVTVKDAKTGRTVRKPIRDFSDADQKYLRQLIR